MEYVGFLFSPVAGFRYLEMMVKPPGILAKDPDNLILPKGVKLPFHSFAVRIQRAIKAAFGRDHFPVYPSQCFGYHLFIMRGWALLVRSRIMADRMCVVIQLFLQMRNVPIMGDRISCKVASKMIVNAAGCHLMQEEVHVVDDVRLVGKQTVTKQEHPII